MLKNAMGTHLLDAALMLGCVLSFAQQLRAQRQEKWQALLAWAANHRALREQAAGGGHH